MAGRLEQEKEAVLLRRAVENTNEAFVTIDENHRVFFFNKAAERMFGYQRDEVVGNDLDVIMSPGCSRDHRKALQRYMETGEGRRVARHTEIQAVRKDGQTFPAEISFSVTHLEGRPFFTAIVRDLTETKALEEQIKRAERLAALGQVVAEITHEIKNPLMMIGGFAQQLTRSVQDEQTLSKLKIISEEVSRLESLIQELREYYLPRSLDLEPIDVGELLEEVHALIKDDCDRNRIRLELEQTGRPVVVEGDRAKLKQVLLNLVTNAIDAMGQGGALKMESRAGGDRAEILISDTGPGIPGDQQEKVFSTFFTTKKQGTGLGLSISKNIVEQHPDGALTLDSDKGEGTTFKITLPLRGSSQPEAPPDQAR